MYINKTKKWILTAVTLIIAISLFLFPPFRSAAQSGKREIPGTNEERDSTNDERKSVTMDGDEQFSGIDSRSLDEGLKEVYKAVAEINKINWKEANASVRLAMEEARAAMKKMKNIDMHEVKAQLKAAEVQMHKARMQMREAGIEMEKIKNIRMDAIKEQLKHAKSEMYKAKMEAQKAKIYSARIKGMIAEMKKDGLIKDDRQLRINWKNRELFINGQKQPENIKNKYKVYIDGDE